MTELTNHTSIAQVLKQNPTTMSDDYLIHFFYDWFCKDTSLPAKSRKLLGKLKAISPSKRFDAEKTYTFFKNNCPGNGSLYDDFRICDLVTGDVVYCIVPASGHKVCKGEASVWGKAPDSGEFEELVVGDWHDVKRFFAMPTLGGVIEMIKSTRMFNLQRQAEYDNVEFDREQRNKLWEEERAIRDEAREYRDQLSHLLGVQV